MTRKMSCSLLALVASMALGLAACSSTPVDPMAMSDRVPIDGVRGSSPASQSTAPTPLPALAGATVTHSEYLDPQNPLSSQRSVYFDFDAVSIRDEDVPLIERHGRFLASHSAVRIKIEGNTDERGGVEYNLALGQKRAESVLRALQIYGVKASQAEAISWGESRPRAAGHGESAWARNRRADLQYPQK